MQFPFRWPVDELLPEDFERLDFLFVQAVKSHFPCDTVSFVRLDQPLKVSSQPDFAAAAATGEPVPDAAGSGLFLPFTNEKGTVGLAVLAGGRPELYAILRSRKRLLAHHHQLARELRQLKQWCIDPVTGLPNGCHLREKLKMQLASSLDSSHHLVLIEIYPWARNAEQGLRSIAKVASQLDSFLGRVAPLHHLGSGVFAQVLVAEEEQVLAMGNSILRWLQRENVVRGHLGIVQVQDEGEENTAVESRVEKLFDRAWQALHVARRRAPHALCTYAFLDPCREHPLQKPLPAVAGELRRQWRGVDLFALVLLHQDQTPAEDGLPDHVRAAAGPENVFLPLSAGEAFVLLPGAGREEAVAWGDLFRKRLPPQLSYSMGIALFPCADFKKTEMPLNARKALLHTRFLGPASVTIFDSVSLNISGDHYYEEGDLARAVKEYRRGLALDGTNVNLLNSLGVAYAQMNRYRQAIPLFEQALADDSENFMALFNLGYAHLHFGHTLRAVECFERAVARESGHFDLLLQLGKLYCQIGRYREALVLFTQAEALDTDDPKSDGQGRLSFYLGQACKGMGEHRQALVHLERAVRYNPRDARAISLLGELYAREGQGHEVSLSLCRQAVEIDDSRSEHWYQLGLVQWLAGREEEAVIALRRSLRLERTHLEALRLLAEIYNHQGRHAKARQTWTRLLRLRPDDEKAWQALQRQNEKPSFRGDSDAKDARV